MTNMIPGVHYEDIEIDKIRGAWVLTYWLSETVALRLKIAYVSGPEPANVVAEVRTTPAQEFEAIHRGLISVYAVTHLDECPEEWSEMPDIYTGEFMAMAQVFAKISYLAEFGSSVSDRYASEPSSSRDHYDQD